MQKNNAAGESIFRNQNQTGRVLDESLASIYCMNSIAILGSARVNGNTSAALQRLIVGTDCEVIDLRTRSIALYNYESDYPAHDQFISLIQQIIHAPIVIIATPVYWYSYSASMKVFIDRFSDLLGSNKELGRQLRGKYFALVSTSSEPQPDRTLVDAFSCFCDYLGIIFVGCAHTQETGEFIDSAVVIKIKRYLNGASDRAQ